MAVLRLFIVIFCQLHKYISQTEVWTIILRCWMGLNLIWFKSCDPKRKYFRFHFFYHFVKKNSFVSTWFWNTKNFDLRVELQELLWKYFLKLHPILIQSKYKISFIFRKQTKSPSIKSKQIGHFRSSSVRDS